MKKLLSIIFSAVILVTVFCSCQKPKEQTVTKTETASSRQTTANDLSVTAPKEDKVTAATEEKETSSQTTCKENKATTKNRKVKVKAKTESNTKTSKTTKTDSNKKAVTVKPDYSPLEIEIFKLINKERKKAGLNPLKQNHTVYPCAKVRAQEADINWSHTRPDGRKYYTVISDFGLEGECACIGENLGIRFDCAKQIMELLMNSEGHRANILREGYTSVAVCVVPMAKTPDKYVLAQIFVQDR